MRTKNSFNDENVRITSVKPRYYIYKESFQRKRVRERERERERALL